MFLGDYWCHAVRLLLPFSSINLRPLVHLYGYYGLTALHVSSNIPNLKSSDVKFEQFKK